MAAHRLKSRLVVAHVPKCGGTSLLGALEASCGRAYVQRVYQMADRTRLPAEKPMPGKMILFGHFKPTPLHPDWDAGHKVALMRHPVDRFVSQYALWRSADSWANPDPWRDKIRAGEVSIFEFAMMKSVHLLYSELMFGGVNMSDFDLIMFQEHFAYGLHRLADLISVPLKEFSSNRSVEYAPRFKEVKAALGADPDVQWRLAAIFAKDIAFFEYCQTLPCAALPPTQKVSGSTTTQDDVLLRLRGGDSLAGLREEAAREIERLRTRLQSQEDSAIMSAGVFDLHEDDEKPPV